MNKLISISRAPASNPKIYQLTKRVINWILFNIFKLYTVVSSVSVILTCYTPTNKVAHMYTSIAWYLQELFHLQLFARLRLLYRSLNLFERWGVILDYVYQFITDIWCNVEQNQQFTILTLLFIQHFWNVLPQYIDKTEVLKCVWLLRSLPLSSSFSEIFYMHFMK